MGFLNKQQFQKDLDAFADNVIPREFIRRQIDAILFLRTRLVTYTKQADATGHAGNNWIVTVDNEVPKERGKSLRSWQTEPTTATFQTNQEIRDELTGFKIGARTLSLSTFWVTNMASRKEKDGGHFYYLQSLVDGNSEKIPMGFTDICIAETRDFIARQGMK